MVVGLCIVKNVRELVKEQIDVYGVKTQNFDWLPRLNVAFVRMGFFVAPVMAKVNRLALAVKIVRSPSLKTTLMKIQENKIKTKKNILMMYLIKR
jgi:hypothetical protein